MCAQEIYIYFMYFIRFNSEKGSGNFLMDDVVNSYSIQSTVNLPKLKLLPNQPTD